MVTKKIVLDSINIDDRIIFPIALLEMDVINNYMFGFNLKVVAFKIIEKELTYFINISLSEEEFKDVKKIVEEK